MIQQTNYALATVEGLHLSCDFVIHSAALFGCPPNYVPTPVRLHDAYAEPYSTFGGLPFNRYDEMVRVAEMDARTLESMALLPGVQRLKDFTCLAFELDSSGYQCAALDSPEAEQEQLERILEQGERILDIIRLFVFKPGEKRSIGRVGGLGGGICGIWLGNEERAKFIARKLVGYQFVQPPLEVSLNDVRKIYEDPTFKELRTVGCGDPNDDDPLIRRVVQGLHSFRKSRDLVHPENRFLELVRIAEHLAKRTQSEKLKGTLLRDRIARIADRAWLPQGETLRVTTDLWDKVRNPLTHSAETFSSLGRDPDQDIPNLEELVVGMLQAVVLAWRMAETGEDPYDYLLTP